MVHVGLVLRPYKSKVKAKKRQKTNTKSESYLAGGGKDAIDFCTPRRREKREREEVNGVSLGRQTRLADGWKSSWGTRGIDFIALGWLYPRSLIRERIFCF